MIIFMVYKRSLTVAYTAVEIANLKKEAAAFKNVRKAMLSSATGEASGLVFDKVDRVL
jgi:hypothetical protein